jgi:hypothetical protein
MKMIPPKLVEPPWETIAAIATSIRPTNIVKNPRMKSVRNFVVHLHWRVRLFHAFAPRLFPRLLGQEMQHYDQHYEKCREDY